MSENQMTPEMINIILQTVPLSEDRTSGKSSRGALCAYAANINKLDALGPTLKLICHKHASLLIEPKQYSIVGKYLIEAMEQVLGEAFILNTQAAWTTAYWQLAKIMIENEASLYRQREEWTTWRDFRIANTKRESSEITSFYLQPVDGKSLPPFAPGQYISVRMYVPILGYAQARQYSLSDRPNPGQYRISVKREDGFDVKRPSM
ncbi:hypothetical protein VE03_07435 [Pseudogymnoascus sp. 23342-1-I1]|nr:hypothetical protein VE03_07435 [Pseudogymnoascus sp. 23342-1-I1]